jgi:hypothetical protein
MSEPSHCPETLRLLRTLAWPEARAYLKANAQIVGNE